MKRTIVIANFNQKGGVAKTTSAVGLTDRLALQNQKILLVDFDQQGNTTSTYLKEKDKLHESQTLWKFFSSKNELEKLPIQCDENISVLAAHKLMADYAGTDVTSWLKYGKNFRDVFNNYDYVIIDCPPAICLYSRLAIAIADYVMLPLQPTAYCYDGLATALETIMDLRAVNPNFKDILGVVTMYRRPTTNDQERFVEIYKKELGEYLLEKYFPWTTKITERVNYFENIFTCKESRSEKIIKEYGEALDLLISRMA